MTAAPLSRAVVERRIAPRSGLDYFPTPPWATRALVEHLTARGELVPAQTIWEPAAGGGHMAEVLRETNAVFPSDIHDYGVGYAVGSFISLPPGAPFFETRPPLPSPWCDGPDWIVSNPPFSAMAEFIERAVDLANVGVAFLTRTTFLEGGDRYHRLFSVDRCRPSRVLQFAGRVPMQEGRWNPAGKTATSYAWIIWLRQRDLLFHSEFAWIDPGARARLTRLDDGLRFAGEVAPCALHRAIRKHGPHGVIEGPF